MVKYRFAFDNKKTTIIASEIAGKTVSNKFYCISCGEELIARVNGKIQQPHFAHKVKAECNGETYLHKLGKAVFVETYNSCLESGKPFIIKLKHEKKCKKFFPLLISECSVGHIEKEYDLTDYYHEVRVESRDGSFIPDVMLVSKSRENDKIYIEIAVTHFLSSEKENSDNRIIEIPIESEDDIEKIKEAKLSDKNSMFFGFNQESTSITDVECKCLNKKHYVFYVYDNGRSIINYSELSTIQSKINKNRSKLLYVNILTSKNETNNGLNEIGSFMSSLYSEQVYLAHERKIAIKNCNLCRYHGFSWTVGKGIFCKTYKKDCSSNDAVDCDRYRPEI